MLTKAPTVSYTHLDVYKRQGLHDVYEPLAPPYRREIPIYKPRDRIGLPYIQVDPKKDVYKRQP